MGREVPYDIDVGLIEPEAQSRTVDVANVAQMTTHHEISKFPHGRVVLERVAGHEQHTVRIGRVDQRLTLGHARGERFFDEHVTAGVYRRESETRVGSRRRRDDNRVHPR